MPNKLKMNKEPVVATGFEAVVCKTWEGWDAVDTAYLYFEQVVLTAPYATMLGVKEIPFVEFDLNNMVVHFFLSDEENAKPITKKLQLNVLD
ncbi:NAD-dependent epimerase/dehydratase family protein [Vibrio phage VPG01]|nr:NAD-dependent epimerase/dehydratase family protein [Vibrio phage VPG01]